MIQARIATTGTTGMEPSRPEAENQQIRLPEGQGTIANLRFGNSLLGSLFRWLRW